MQHRIRMLPLLVLLAFSASAAAEGIARQGVLRVAYLVGNPVQVQRDPVSGALSGVSVDLARELARREGASVELLGRQGIQAVIDAVRNGEVEIGFLANDPSRRGAVAFSQTYLRNPQSFVVPEDSPIRAFDVIDRPGVRLGVTTNDSIALYLARTLRSASLVELPNPGPDDIRQALESGRIDAFGANRTRLVAIAAGVPGLRILPGSLFGVPQAIAIAPERSDVLAAVNVFLEDVRSNGFLAASIARAANGTEMEPAPAR